jgi:copper chaperone NosL
MRLARRLVWAAIAAGVACGEGPLPPAALDSNEACRHCRMAVSDRGLASQIAARGEETRFFDDLGCLRNHLRHDRTLPSAFTVYVADHRTREWVDARTAVFSRVDAIQTPMGSHWIAHASEASRDQDPAVAGAVPVPAADVIGPFVRETTR